MPFEPACRVEGSSPTSLVGLRSSYRQARIPAWSLPAGHFRRQRGRVVGAVYFERVSSQWIRSPNSIAGLLIRNDAAAQLRSCRVKLGGSRRMRSWRSRRFAASPYRPCSALGQDERPRVTAQGLPLLDSGCIPRSFRKKHPFEYFADMRRLPGLRDHVIETVIPVP